MLCLLKLGFLGVEGGSISFDLTETVLALISYYHDGIGWMSLFRGSI